MNDITLKQNSIEDLKECMIYHCQPLEITAKLAIEALEKQIPKKPIFKDGIASHYYCPTCGRLYWEKEDINQCCDLCGQRLER